MTPRWQCVVYGFPTVWYSDHKKAVDSVLSIAEIQNVNIYSVTEPFGEVVYYRCETHIPYAHVEQDGYYV